MSQSRKHVDVALDSAELLVAQMKLGWTCSLERWLFFRQYLDRSTLAEEQSEVSLEEVYGVTDHLVDDLNSICDGTGLESHVGHPGDQVCNRDICRMMCIKIDTLHLLYPLWYRV